MKKGLFSLSPLLLFLFLYLGTSIIVGDFYKIPITVAFLISSIYALSITPGKLIDRVKIFSQGAGECNLMLMIWIFLLAGAFASSAKAMGAVDATVHMTLHILPASLLLPGLFIASCFISLAIGTSVGTIAALTPVAVGIASSADVSIPLMIGLVVGGAYFGDNLSFISDTTIAATQTQGCRMKDKFEVNFRIVLPIAIIVMLGYLLFGQDVSIPAVLPTLSFWKVLPYIAVIISAVCGLHVLLVLILGILLSGTIGLIDGSYDLFGWFSSMADGMMGMSELIIMTLLAAGMLSLIRHNGGIDYIIRLLTRRISSKSGAEASISALVSLINICTANNTIAIITSGPIAADIARRYNIDKRKSASLLDTASCITQGLLPYGAQLLIAAGLAEEAIGNKISPISIMPYLYYPMTLGVAIIICIVFRLPRKYS